MKTSLVDKHSVELLLLVAGALRSGLVDAMAGAGGRSADQVAEAAGTDARATRIVLEALATVGVVERTPGAGMEALYRLSPVGRAHLLDEGPELERSGLLHHANKVRGWLELPEVIRTGEPAFKGTGGRDVRTRSFAMGERDAEVLDEIVERCLGYAGHIGSMIDVGGAVGHLALRFARKGVRATLFDKEEVMLLAREYLGAEAGGLVLMGGDYTAELPRGPFDLVYFGNVYHIYGAETNARVTREVFGMVAPGGSVAIQDYVWGRSAEAAMFAVNMLRSTVDGEVWPEERYHGWLREAGFDEIVTIDLETAPAQLILARRP